MGGMSEKVLYSALDLDLAIFFFKHLRESRTDRLAVEYLLLVRTVRILEKSSPVLHQKVPCLGVRIECKFVVDE